MSNPFGTTRSVIARDHALFAPGSFVSAPLPGWERTQGVILISPRLGAQFTQYLAFVEPGSAGGAARPGVERFVYIEAGEALLETAGPAARLGAGAFAWLPPGEAHTLRAETAAGLIVFERRYRPLSGGQVPGIIIGQEQKVEDAPFLGDPDARLKSLLPDDPAFDMAVNIFTYHPGAALPQVEVHVMEHGLSMLAGTGVYRMSDAWYPVQKGDVLWMAPYCPQWFVAMGKTPARYLYYKDVNRDTQEEPG